MAEETTELQEYRDKFYNGFDMRIDRYYFMGQYVFMDDINQSFLSKLFQMQEFEWLCYPADDVILDIDEEYDNHTESNRGGRALAGGLMFGPVGAVVGAASGRQVHVNNLTRLKISFYARDTGKRLFVINALRLVNGGTSVKVGSLKYNEAVELAQDIIDWYDRYR